MGWKRLAGVGALAGLVGCGALLKDPRQETAGGTIDVTLSNVQGATLVGTSYQAKTVTGNYNAADRQFNDAGWTVIAGTANALDASSQKCRGIGVGFGGRPTAGTTFTLALLNAPDGGRLLLPDGGAPDTTGLATVNWVEGCANEGQFSQWIASGGSLTVDAVGEPPASANLSGTKQVKFHVSGAQLGVFAGSATGTFTLDATGTADNVSGMQ